MTEGEYHRITQDLPLAIPNSCLPLILPCVLSIFRAAVRMAANREKPCGRRCAGRRKTHCNTCRLRVCIVSVLLSSCRNTACSRKPPPTAGFIVWHHPSCPCYRNCPTSSPENSWGKPCSMLHISAVIKRY